MSLPLLHAGRTNPGLSAALDLRFALDKSLTAYRGPTPSFSRASTGSYFDGSGVLRYANVNTILYSEQIENAYWFKSGLSISADSTVAPDGKATADKVVENASGGIKYGTIAGGFAVISGTTYTFSAYAKDSGRYFGFATNSTAFPNAIGAVFNLSNGTISNIQANTTASIQSVGNGWYRCIITGTANASTTTNINFGISNDLNQIYPSYTGNGSSGYFLWGFQMETGSTAGTYFPTTSSANSAPRFDHTYNGTSWVSRGLLVEEQRTNLCLQSNGLNSSPWSVAAGRGTVTQNATSPDGTTNAWTGGCTVTASGGFYLVQTGISASPGTYTLSMFGKKGNNGYFAIQFYSTSLGSNAYAFFDLNLGTSGNTFSSGYTLNSYGIIDCGNGWYRCYLTITKSDSNALEIYPYLSCNSMGSFACTSGQTNLFFGMQLESGSFPTSYIPTTSAATTRSADVCQITGTDFSGFWNGTEGTLACEFDRLSSVTSTFSSGFPHAVSLVDSGNLVRQGFYGGHSGASPTGEIFLYNGSGRITAGALVSGTSPIKISGAYKASDFAGSLNGATAVTSSSGSIDPVVQMNIGAWASSQYMLNGHIARLRYYRKRLPNATLQLLSEPDPTLNLQFALNKTLTPVAGPAPSFSRASTGTYFNASGVLTSASINTPRFDHVFSGGQWSSRGLLLEEQRTNLILQSSSLPTSPWSNTDYTITSETSPDGTSNAQKLVAPASNASRRIEQAVTGTAASYSLSFYAKSAGWNFVQICYGWNSDYVNFDLANGVISNSSGSTIGSIQNIGNGWYRCIGTFTAGASTQGIRIIPMATSIASRFPNTTGDGVNGIIVFGVQFELGAFPTSYIGTTSSSVTRSADVCQITGTSFNWMWNQGEGSAFAEWDTYSASSPQMVASASAAANPADNFIAIRNGTFYGYVSGVEQFSLVYSVTSNTPNKVSGAYKTNDFAASLNGAAVLTDTTGILPTQSQFDIGQTAAYSLSPYKLNGHIAKLIYYPARLTNTKLQQLST